MIGPITPDPIIRRPRPRELCRPRGDRCCRCGAVATRATYAVEVAPGQVLSLFGLFCSPCRHWHADDPPEFPAGNPAPLF